MKKFCKRVSQGMLRKEKGSFFLDSWEGFNRGVLEVVAAAEGAGMGEKPFSWIAFYE